MPICNGFYEFKTNGFFPQKFQLLPFYKTAFRSVFKEKYPSPCIFGQWEYKENMFIFLFALFFNCPQMSLFAIRTTITETHLHTYLRGRPPGYSISLTFTDVTIAIFNIWKVWPWNALQFNVLQQHRCEFHLSALSWKWGNHVASE